MLDFSDLRPSQRRAIDFITGRKRGLLLAGMGTGKTVITLTALEQLHALGERDDEPCLILGPLRVARSVWPAEPAGWRHLAGVRAIPIVGTPTQRVAAIKSGLAEGVRYFAINYENLPWLAETLGDKWPWRTVVADESTKLSSFRGHFRVREDGSRTLYRGTKGSQANALARYVHSRVKRFHGLTGTPTLKGLGALWGQAWMVDGGQSLGRTFGAFEEAYFVPTRRPGSMYPAMDPAPDAQERVMAAVAPFTHVVEFEGNVREPNVVVVPYDLPSGVRKTYNTLEREAVVLLDSGETLTGVNAGAVVNKLRQVAVGAAYNGDDVVDIHDEAIEALRSVVSELGGAPLLCGFHYRPTLAKLLRAFPRAVELDANPETIRRWNRGEIEILLAHPASAGHGLSLQHGGHNAALVEPDWSVENFEQFVARIGPVRQAQSGYNRSVNVYLIEARNTVHGDIRRRRELRISADEALRRGLRERQGG